MERDYTEKKIIQRGDWIGKNYIRRNYTKETILYKRETIWGRIIYKRLYYSKKRLYRKEII